MNRRLILVAVSIIGGVILTLLTFPYTRPVQQISCVSTLNYTPGAIMPPSTQNKHGYPLGYFKEHVPTNCSIPDTQDADLSSAFYPEDFALDVLAGSLLSGAVLAIVLYERNLRHKK